MINQRLKQWRIGSMTHQELPEVAKLLNPKIRGWIEYYGHARPSELYKLAELIDIRLVKWLKHKFKIRINGKAWGLLKSTKSETPNLVYHWGACKKLCLRGR